VNVTAPLDGLTVLEIASFVAAPLGGLTLAQLGADVIRIDPVGGGADLGRARACSGPA
jgi:2-methylfumaryl-CoA isomerase